VRKRRIPGRGGGRDLSRLLREEKMRKRVGKEKPKVCQFLFILSTFRLIVF
jgi:hypothetical protein